MEHMMISIGKFNRIYLSRLIIATLPFVVGITLVSLSMSGRYLVIENKQIKFILALLTIISMGIAGLSIPYYILQLAKFTKSFVVVSDRCFTYYEYQGIIDARTVVYSIGDLDTVKISKGRNKVTITGKIQTYIRASILPNGVYVGEVEKVEIPNVFNHLEKLCD